MASNSLEDQIIVHMIVIGGGFLVQKMFIPNKNQKGQATIEFLLVFAFALGITFLFLSLAINATQGYVAQYANYMASRTFLTHDIGSNNNFTSSVNMAERAAGETFRRYPLSAFDINPEFKVLKPAMGAASSLFSGTTIKFEKRLTPFKLVGGGAMITLFTESFLTKEPVRYSCWKGVCNALGQNNCEGGLDITMFDNGC
jgi:hypothetical protein